MEFIQHILPYFAVFCHVLGGRRVKAGGNEKPAKQVCLAGIEGRIINYCRSKSTKKDYFPAPCNLKHLCHPQLKK